MRGGAESLLGVKEAVAERVTPKPRERVKVERLARRLVGMVSEAAEASGVEAEVALEGSVAKDTWLSGEADVDVFLLIPASKDRRYLEVECLSAIRMALKDYPTVERYAEHPYLEAYVEGVRVNVVPCFKVERGMWMSAADRTPFHTAYMNGRLTENLRREVKVLKRFMKGCSLYGAEARVRGFSGFLCELLTLNYGSFEDVVAAASGWRRGEIIDVESYYKGREQDASKLFPEPLIAVDPVDTGRNAAAAVAEDSMWSFVSTSRLVMETPRIEFFYPESSQATQRQLRKAFEGFHGDLIVIDFGEIDAVVDVVWSQLYKAERILRSFLERMDFKVIRSWSWSSDGSHSLILFKLESAELPPTFKHLGPPIEMAEGSGRFLNRHLEAPDAAAGPWISGGRWVVEEARGERSAVKLIEKSLLDAGLSIGMPSKISESLKKGFKILLNREVVTLTGIPGAAEEIYRFISGRPAWLEASS